MTSHTAVCTALLNLIISTDRYNSHISGIEAYLLATQHTCWWAGHLTRMDDDRLPKIILYSQQNHVQLYTALAGDRTSATKVSGSPIWRSVASDRRIRGHGIGQMRMAIQMRGTGCDVWGQSNTGQGEKKRSAKNGPTGKYRFPMQHMRRQLCFKDWLLRTQPYPSTSMLRDPSCPSTAHSILRFGTHF